MPSSLQIQAERRENLRSDALSPSPAPAQPIDMVLHCPKCGLQHIDAPDTNYDPHYEGHMIWTNPPHRSHLCHGCRHIWRPADVHTNGVQTLKTKGKDDSPPVTMQAVAQVVEQLENSGDGWFARIQWMFNPVPVGEVLYWPQEKQL